mgnify:CR=1 FL=1
MCTKNVIAMVCKAEMDVVDFLTSRYLPGALPFIGYFSNKLKVPVNFVVEKSKWDKKILKHPNKKF